MSDSPLPNRLILWWTITRVDQPSLAEPGDHLLVEHDLHLGRDAGQAGDDRPAEPHPDPRARSRRGSAAARRRRGTAPGRGSARPSAGSGGRTWPAIASSDAGSSTSGTPATCARASRVRSSWVGPSPPVITTRSARPARDPERLRRSRPGRRRASCGTGPGCPPPASARLSHWLFVSSDWPLTSSSPMAMISAFMAGVVGPWRSSQAFGARPPASGPRLRVVTGPRKATPYSDLVVACERFSG